MAKPRGYSRIRTGFWDTHPNERMSAEALLNSGTRTYREIVDMLRTVYGNLSGFNMAQMSKLKQRLKVTKK